MRWHGYDPKEATVFVSPRKVSKHQTVQSSNIMTAAKRCQISPQGEHFWRTEDVVQLIEEQGDSVSLVWLPGG